jgi:prepilin-type N-terminal cleavage/methylation domain-containing protein
MRKLRGFTLIELLIVVAIIAILAAIAVPNFLEAQIRSKVTRAKSDMRSIATAIESYMVDLNQYPASQDQDSATNPFSTVNAGLGIGNTDFDMYRNRMTFATLNLKTNLTHRFMTVTTPVSYISTLPSDPFAKRGCVFGYINAVDAGWIMWSYGPDTDNQTGSLDGYFANMADWDSADEWTAPGQSVYNPFTSNPSDDLMTGGFQGGGQINAYRYDTTNGSTSTGDVYQIMGGGA